MPIETAKISDAQAEKIRVVTEGQFSDVKAIDIQPAKLTKTISAFANSDGGDVYVGIAEDGSPRHRSWRGFSNPEAANGHVQIFEKLFPLGTDFQYEFLKSDSRPGIVLHIQINKTQGIMRAANDMPYIRRGAQSLPVDTPEMLRRLEYAKGITSFESQLTNIPKESVTESIAINRFIRQVVPTSTPESWLKKQLLLREDKPTVAAALLFADEPQALSPKRCGVKIYRYKTAELEGFRDALAFDPITIEGCLYEQIGASVKRTTEIAESIPKMGEGTFERIKYPGETLHEIITNAVIHRDYSIADDVHIRIFDNRIEVQSPGRLPAHVTVDNILTERFARNGAIVRILNKFPDPPNKDVGEGLNTAWAAMHKLGLKEPKIFQQENAVIIIIKHESLASPEEAIMDFLETHPTIRNSEARKVTHIQRDHQIKSIFGRMVQEGMIEQIPNTRTNSTAYRKVKKHEPSKPKNGR